MLSSILFQISRLGMFASVSVFYFSMAFVVFMLYCVFLQIIPHKRDFDYIIIHGAGHCSTATACPSSWQTGWTRRSRSTARIPRRPC